MRLWKGWASTGECWARSWSMQRVSRAEINIAEMEVSSLQSCPIMIRYRCEDHAGCSPDCSVHRPHLGNYKASKSFRFYNRCVYCFVLSMCAIMPGPGHGAKYRPGQWPDIPETEVQIIFLTIFWALSQMVCFKVKEERDSDRARLVLWDCKCWCWQYICRPGLYPDRGAAGRRPSAQHRRAGQGGLNSE